jgi:light-regulated signal transduction histidine kinase (bacteriophytochrome)
MLGYEPNEILDRDFGDIFAKDAGGQPLPGGLIETAGREKRSGSEVTLVRKGGELLRLNATVIALRGASQNLRGFFCVLHNAHRAGSEPPKEPVERAEAANNEMEKFTHAVALDLQLPLRDIETCSGLLMKSVGEHLDQKNHSYLATIQEAAHRMGRLVDDLSKFSRIGQAQMYHLKLSLKDVATEVIHDMRSELDGRTVEWVVGELPEVCGDSVMLWQVMTNLIANALKFTRTREHARIEIGSRENEREHTIFVRDNGVGFDSTCADQLFVVFQRLHSQEFEGTGMGLANVRRIIERHGGRVWAEGATGEGATFYFTIPKES